MVIPSSIDGLSVWKINETAFIMCTKLRSVKIPATVREIGARAFSDCRLLTNITFASGIVAIGDSAFDGRQSLYSGNESGECDLRLAQGVKMGGTL